MLTVEDYEIIRREVIKNEMTQREVSRQYGYSRNTIAKALKHAIPPGYQQNKARSKPAIEAFTAILDEWILQNKTTRRKQRMEVTKMHQRLCDEYGFKGHYSTVQRYVKETTNRTQDVFMTLAFEPGE